MKITDNKYVIIILFASLFGLLIFKPYFLEQPTGKYIATAPSPYGYGGEPCPSGITTASPCPEGQYCCESEDKNAGSCTMEGDSCCSSKHRALGYNPETSKCCIAKGDSDFQPIEIIAYDEVCCEEKARNTGKCARGEKCCYSGDFLSHACVPPAGTCCRTYTTAEGCVWGVQCCQSKKRQEIGEISYPLAASCKMSGAACCESEETRVSQMFCPTGQVCCKTPDGDATCYDPKEGTCCKGRDEYGEPLVCKDGEKCCGDGYGQQAVCYNEDPIGWAGPYTCCNLPDSKGNPLICDEGEECCGNYFKTIGGCIDEDEDDCCELKDDKATRCVDSECCVNPDLTDAVCYDRDDQCCLGGEEMKLCDGAENCCFSKDKKVSACLEPNDCCSYNTGLIKCEKDGYWPGPPFAKADGCCVSYDGSVAVCCDDMISYACCKYSNTAFCLDSVNWKLSGCPQSPP